MAMNKSLAAGAAAIVLGGLGLWYTLETGGGRAPEASPPVDAPADKGPAAPPPPAIAHPLPIAASAAGDAERALRGVAAQPADGGVCRQLPRPGSAPGGGGGDPAC